MDLTGTTARVVFTPARAGTNHVVMTLRDGDLVDALDPPSFEAALPALNAFAITFEGRLFPTDQ